MNDVVSKVKPKKQRIRYSITVNDSDGIPNEARGLDVKSSGYSPKQALSGYLVNNNKLYLFEELWYRFLFEEGVNICPIDEKNKMKRGTFLSDVGKEGQVHYLTELFAHARYDKSDGTRSFDYFWAEEGAKLNKMPDNQVFAIFVKYYSN